MVRDLAWASAAKLLKGYRKRRFSPVEATRAVLDRIEALNGDLNAYCLVDRDGALAAAAASEKRWLKGDPLGLLDGVPVSVKDLLLWAGRPTLRGSRTIDRNQPFDVDAPSVARLKDNGAVLVGKTTTPEFGWKGVTDSPLTGVTRNPWDRTKTPGGSSGGASAAVAAGMAPLALGTDGGGSIRIPAAFAGIVAGWQAMRFVTNEQLGPVIGVIVLVMLALNYWRTRAGGDDAPVPSQWWFAATLGFIAGLTTMMANAAGPVMVIYLLAMRLAKLAFVGTSAWFFFVINWFACRQWRSRN